MNKFKVYVSACHDSHANWMEPIGGKIVKNLEEADVILYGGGADIEPSTYNEIPSIKTYTSPRREVEERADFQTGTKLGKLHYGICRGLQLLCALGGGKLIQDVTNHAGANHSMTTYDGIDCITNSLHHQMVSPYNLPDSNYRVLAWSTKKRSEYYIGGKDKKLFFPIQFKEIEAMYLPKIKAAGVQYHPEMMYNRENNNPVVDWTQKMFLNFLDNKL